MHAPECLRQRLGRDHEAIHQAQGTTEDLPNVARHLGPMQALQGQFGQIVVQLVDPEGAVERLHPGNGSQLLFTDLPLENHTVDLQALQRHRLQERLAEQTIQQAGVAQRAERLTHAIVAAAVGIGRMRQDPRQRRTPEQGLPVRNLGTLESETGGLQAEIAVVGRISRQSRKPAPIQGLVGRRGGHSGACVLGQDRIGRPHGQVAEPTGAQAEVDVGVAVGEIVLVESSDLVVHRALEQ